MHSVNSLTDSTFDGRWSGSNPIQGRCPVSSRNSGCWVEEWTWLLYWNSARGRRSTQSSCHWLMKSLKYCSSSWFTRSVCPSPCGWYAVVAATLIPSNLYSSLVNSATNWGPLSEMTRLGSPWCFQTCWTNNLVDPVMYCLCSCSCKWKTNYQDIETDSVASSRGFT